MSTHKHAKSQHNAKSSYAVHWMLKTDESARKYGEVIRRAWWKQGKETLGERSLSCDYAASVVVVRFETTADDIAHAVKTSEAWVLGPLDGSGLALPESMTIVVGLTHPAP